MGMVVLFRESVSESRFKRALLEMIEKSPGDTLIIASGYVSALVTAPVTKWKFDTALKKNVPEEWGTPYLEELVTSIKKDIGIKEIVFCAGDFDKHKELDKHNKPQGKCIDNKNSRHQTHGGTCHLCDYNFGKELFKNAFSGGPKITFIDSLNWHAKFAIKLTSKTKQPHSFLIGSSNLSGVNFSESGNLFNHECDIYIWDGKEYSSQFTEAYSNFNLFSLAVSPVKPVKQILVDLYSHFAEQIQGTNPEDSP